MERRKFLTGTGALAAGLAASGTLFSPKEAIARSFGIPVGSGGTAADQKFSNFRKGAPTLQAESSDLTPYTGPWTDTQLLHLLRRAMFGVPIAQYAAAKNLGSMAAVVNKLTDMSAPLPVGPSYVNQYLSPVKGNQVASSSNQHLEIMRTQEVVDWWFDLMAKENLSMREKLTYMWTNHFVTGWSMVQHAGFTYQYLQLMRKYALGNLQQFVYQVSIDPSMLVYLNGNQNTAGNVNENYARELMELFTIGLVDPKNPTQPNYTEADVQNSARSLSGWQPSEIPGATEPYFVSSLKANLHDNTTKTFLGDAGNLGLQDILNTLFGLEGGYKVAWFISQTIYETFVYYNPGLPGDGSPSQGVIQAMANLLIQSNWELKPVVQALLSSAHFYDPNVIGAQLKSPAEFIVGIVRDFGITYTPFSPVDPPANGVDSDGATVYTDPNLDISYLTGFVMNTELGQSLLDPPNVKGWPGGENWIGTGTFPVREAISQAVLANLYKNNAKYPYSFDALAWAQSYPNVSSMTVQQIATSLTNVTLANPLGPIESAAALKVLDPNGTDFALTSQYTGDIQSFAEYLAGLPEYQLT